MLLRISRCDVSNRAVDEVDDVPYLLASRETGSTLRRLLWLYQPCAHKTLLYRQSSDLMMLLYRSIEDSALTYTEGMDTENHVSLSAHYINT